MKRKKITMRNALLIFCITSVVFALLLQTFLFHQTLRRQIRTESISDHEISLTKMQTDIASFIHNIRTEMLTIYSEQDLISALRAAEEEGSSMKDYYWRSWYFARKRFTKEDQLLALYLYDTQDKVVSAYRYNASSFPRNLYQTEYDSNTERLYDYVHDKRTDFMISGYCNPDAKRIVVRFVLKLHNYDEERKNIGYLVCDINSSAFTSIMAKYVDIEQVCLWLQPVGDQVIAKTGQVSVSQKRIQKQLSKVIENYYSSGQLEQEYEGNYLIQVPQEEYNLEAFVLVSQSLLTATQKSLIRTLLIIMTAMIGLIVLLVFMLSRWMTKPVEEMRNTIVRIKNGEASLRVSPVGWSEELTVLGTEFNEMLDRIQAMAEEELQNKMLVERTEFKMFQAQINPHFLYNTLESITWMVEAQENEAAVRMISELAKLLRVSLSRGKTIIPIKDELQHSRSYMNIQLARYKERFKTEFRIDEEIENYCIVKLVIQPILENAIYYGVGNMDEDEDGMIIVTGEKRDEDILITIEDNGMGMREEVLENILTDSSKVPKHGSGVGVINVHSRIRLMFGEEYGLFIESEPDEGTKVTIRIPAIPYTPENAETLELQKYIQRRQADEKE